MLQKMQLLYNQDVAISPKRTTPGPLDHQIPVSGENVKSDISYGRNMVWELVSHGYIEDSNQCHWRYNKCELYVRTYMQYIFSVCIRTLT